MRILYAAILALALPSCVTGPEAGAIEEFQGDSAVAIGGGIAASDIRIQNRYVLLFSSHWVATTPTGAVYLCTRDELTADAECKPKDR